MLHTLCKDLGVQERYFSTEEKKVSAGVMVLFTPIPLLQRAGSPLLSATHRGPHAQSSLINAVLLKKNW